MILREAENILVDYIKLSSGEANSLIVDRAKRQLSDRTVRKAWSQKAAWRRVIIHLDDCLPSLQGLVASA